MKIETLVLSLFALLLIVGCSSIKNEQIERARAFCVSHSGIKEIDVMGSNDADIFVKCMDGTEVRLDKIKK